jgi:hypothetical protein
MGLIYLLDSFFKVHIYCEVELSLPSKNALLQLKEIAIFVSNKQHIHGKSI